MELGKEGQPQKYLVRAAFSSFFPTSHLKILVLWKRFKTETDQKNGNLDNSFKKIGNGPEVTLGSVYLLRCFRVEAFP